MTPTRALLLLAILEGTSIHAAGALSDLSSDDPGRRLQDTSAAACAADINLDERVSTDDLLMLLASFGRPAPAGACESTPAPPDATDEFSIYDREFLFCSLRDRVETAVNQVHDFCNETVSTMQTNCTDTLDAQSEEHMAELAALRSDHGYALEQMETEMTNAAAQNQQLVGALEEEYLQRLRALHCPPLRVANADYSGDTTAGGDGALLECLAGYADPASGETSWSLTCSAATGDWTSTIPTCDVVNPCELQEDDCDANAQCAHTGPGTHSCMCNVGGGGEQAYFGTGQECTPCSECPVGSVLTVACTATANSICEPVVCEALNPPANGATSFTNGYVFDSVASFICEFSETPPTETRVCQADGTWSGSTPDCPSPPRWVQVAHMGSTTANQSPETMGDTYTASFSTADSKLSDDDINAMDWSVIKFEPVDPAYPITYFDMTGIPYASTAARTCTPFALSEADALAGNFQADGCCSFTICNFGRGHCYGTIMSSMGAAWGGTMDRGCGDTGPVVGTGGVTNGNVNVYVWTRDNP